MQALLLWLVFMTVATLVTFLLAPSEAESIVRKRMREVRLRSADPDTVEEERLAEPFSRRVILPLLESLSRQLERITPAGVLDKMARKLREAGNPISPGRLLFIKLALTAGLVGIVLAWSAPGLLAGRVEPLTVGGVAWALVAGWALPDFWVSRLGTQRRLKLARTLPDVFDLLSVSVEAGLGFDGAIQKVSEKFTDPTASEFGEYLKEVRLGKTREEALRNLAERTGLPELKAFTAAVIQADRLGVSLSRVLRVQSDQLRTQRMQRAEEAAMQTPIKMVFPLVFFIFPTIFVVLLGPAIIQLVTNFVGR